MAPILPACLPEVFIDWVSELTWGLRASAETRRAQDELFFFFTFLSRRDPI